MRFGKSPAKTFTSNLNSKLFSERQPDNNEYVDTDAVKLFLKSPDFSATNFSSLTSHTHTHTILH